MVESIIVSRMMRLSAIISNKSYLIITSLLFFNISFASRDYIEPSPQIRDGECSPGQFMDCNNNCYPDAFLVFLDNENCDDGTFDIDFSCQEWGHDGASCSSNWSGLLGSEEYSCSGSVQGGDCADECNVPNGDNTSCADCAGVPNGTAVEDECGVCSGGSSGHDANSDMDVCGVCFGGGYYDQCGTCDNDMANDCVQDCTGEWGGNSVVDECGECAGNGYDQCDGDGDGIPNIDDWGYGAYDIMVTDIPNDQGGKVLIWFSRSLFDTDTLRNQEAYTIQRGDGDHWTAVLTLSAYGDSVYYAEATTLQDSSGSTHGLTEFRVIAAMEEGNFVNRPDENGVGYSVDNIIPGPPTNLIAYSSNVGGSEPMVHFAWDYELDIDFAYHQVTGLWGEPSYAIDNSASVNLSSVFYNEYYVNAVDIHGNFSDTSEYVGAYHFEEGFNLVSFNILPEDNSIVNLFSESEFSITGILGEGVAASYIHTDSFGNNIYGWIGSLSHIESDKGYWIQSTIQNIMLTQGPKHILTDFELHEGSNLLSYTCSNVGPVDELIQDTCIEGILGQGVATYYIEGDVEGWIGSLTELIPGSGYWFKNKCGTITLDYDCPEESPGLIRMVENNIDSPQFTQSTLQAFYFIESIDDAEDGDIIEAYNGTTLVGSRVWQGSYTDIPVMGDDKSEFTKDFCTAGSTPVFKLIKKNGITFNITGNIPTWESNGLLIVESLDIIELTPNTYSLASVYPNPFNPSTTVSFTLPELSVVNMVVFDITGREITKLVNGTMEAGYHNLTWNANNQSSGVYLIRMDSGDFTQTQKVVLVK